MTVSVQFDRLENLVTRDPNLFFTIASYVLVLTMYINLNIKSPAIGVAASILYFLINGLFLGQAFFNKEDAFFRFVLGVLLLIMLFGVVGWLIMIIYNLDAPSYVLILFIVATISSSLNKRRN